MKKILLYTGGALNILLALLHASFWKMLNWSSELMVLSPENRAVVQVLNICIILVLLFFALMSFVIARRGVSDVNGRAILLLIAAFYATRLALGYPFFGFSAGELVIWIVCAMLATSYGFIGAKGID